MNLGWSEAMGKHVVVALRWHAHIFYHGLLERIGAPQPFSMFCRRTMTTDTGVCGNFLCLAALTQARCSGKLMPAPVHSQNATCASLHLTAYLSVKQLAFWFTGRGLGTTTRILRYAKCSFLHLVSAPEFCPFRYPCAIACHNIETCHCQS